MNSETTVGNELPPEVREAFHFCLAVAMEEADKAKLLNIAQVDGRTDYSYETVAGDVFSVVRSEISAEMEGAVRQELMRILEEEG